MKVNDVVRIFGTENATKLVNQGTVNAYSKLFGRPRITKPVVAFGVNPDFGEGQLLISGMFDRVDTETRKPTGEYTLSMTENMTGTIHEQDMPLETFNRMLELGIIERLPENTPVQLEQTTIMNDATISDLFKAPEINQMIINGYCDDLCLAAGKELDVPPVASFKDLEIGGDTVLVVGLKLEKGGNEPSVTVLRESADEEEEYSNVFMDSIPLSVFCEMVRGDNVSLERNRDFVPAGNLSFYKEAFSQNGYLVTDHDTVTQIKESLSKEELRSIQRDCIDPTKYDIKKLKDDVSVSGPEM